jgi:cellulose synthase/poly-beta-1,6-N-acetylglucosamine synthase-like glycosyltransferase
VAIGALAMVLVTWLGYPSLVWLRTRWHADPLVPAPFGTDAPRVSVVVATRDGAEAIAARLRNLLETDYPADRLEVVIACDPASGSRDPALGSLETPRVRVVVGDQPGGKAATLNAGVRAASGDVLVFADIAQRFTPSTIAALVAALGDARFGAVSGALMLGDAAQAGSPMRAYWSLEKTLRRWEADWHSSIGVTGAVYAMRRALWPELPAGTILDDVYVPMSVILRGHRVGFVREATATDVRRVAPSVEQARKTRTLAGNVQIVHLLPELLTRANPIRLQFVWHKLARLLTPLWLLIAGVAALPVLLWWMTAWPSTTWGILAGLLGICGAVRPIRRRVVGAVHWVFVLQRATVRALHHALRGRWDVWDV